MSVCCPDKSATGFSLCVLIQASSISIYVQCGTSSSSGTKRLSGKWRWLPSHRHSRLGLGKPVEWRENLDYRSLTNESDKLGGEAFGVLVWYLGSPQGQNSFAPTISSSISHIANGRITRRLWASNTCQELSRCYSKVSTFSPWPCTNRNATGVSELNQLHIGLPFSNRFSMLEL